MSSSSSHLRCQELQNTSTFQILTELYPHKAPIQPHPIVPCLARISLNHPHLLHSGGNGESEAFLVLELKLNGLCYCGGSGWLWPSFDAAVFGGIKQRQSDVRGGMLVVVSAVVEEEGARSWQTGGHAQRERCGR